MKLNFQRYKAEFGEESAQNSNELAQQGRAAIAAAQTCARDQGPDQNDHFE
jgi:hypothetical protein